MLIESVRGTKMWYGLTDKKEALRVCTLNSRFMTAAGLMRYTKHVLPYMLERGPLYRLYITIPQLNLK